MGGEVDMLKAERRRCSFDSAALLASIAGRRPEKTNKFRPLFEDPIFDESSDDYISYVNLAERKIHRVAKAFEIVRSNPSFMAAHMSQRVQMGDMFERNGVYVHFTMSLTFLKSQGSKEQQALWLNKAQNGDFIIAYCQTELGHGSNVRGLETTATFDVSTQEFEIHSPTLTSLKWWPTGMYASTHALVFADLIVGGTSFGFHGFMVQLRKADGTLMPGIELGEIGPKMDGSSTNIGYCRFTRVRVKQIALLSKYSQVTSDGKYKAAPKKLSKFRYISMMMSRMVIVGIAYKNLAQAATIAIRYSAVRRQGYVNSDVGGEENVVLDYKMQQYRTFKALSFAYCLHWTEKYVGRYLRRVQSAIQSGDERAADDLPELHATLMGMKATSTVWAHESIEECRKCCGGQGFLKASGIGRLSPNFAEWVTVEGEQVISSLQLARFLVKAADDAVDGKDIADSVRYIATEPAPSTPALRAPHPRFDPLAPVTSPDKLESADFDLDTGAILALLQERARRFARRLAEKMREAAAKDAHASYDVVLNSEAIFAYRAAEAHSIYFMLAKFAEALESSQSDQEPATTVVLTRLLDLQGLIRIAESSGDWLDLLSEAALDAIHARIGALLDELRRDAVSLVDCFGFSDEQLRSTLGRHDGNVYEAIYKAAAQDNPLNQSETMVGWQMLSEQLDLDFLRQGERDQRALSTPPSASRL